MICIDTLDNVQHGPIKGATKALSARTWTLAAAKSDVERGLLRPPSIHVHDAEGRFFYTIWLQSTLVIDGAGPLVDARTGRTREFKTMDAAYSVIRQAGFRSVWLCVGA